MSDLNKLARPYAKAIFQYASGRKELEKWEEILSFFAQVSKMSDIHKVLTNPSLSESTKLDLILELGKFKGNVAVENFIKELSYQKRLDLFGAIYDVYLLYKNEYESKMNVEVLSALPMSDEQVSKLQKALETKYQKKIDIKVKEDASLIGGFVIGFGDELIDSSIKGRLTKLSETLLTR